MAMVARRDRRAMVNFMVTVLSFVWGAWMKIES
jgi:hypothetical protein